ncbi:MAG: tetratricopeptide repeat protein [Acidobacteria bacterium]|nr:tetratricopeptide repeat protein [Acidobacteriota bacterium]
MRLFIALFCISFFFNTTSAQMRRAPAGNQPQSAAAAFEEGQSAQEKGDLKNAIRFYTAAINAEPKLFQAWYQRATAYLGLGRDREAEQDLQKVMELKPDFARAHRAVGQIYLDAGKTAEALQAFARALELEPQLTGVRVYYASALIKNNAPEKALLQLRAALENGEKSALTFALLGLAEERTNKSDEALADYTQAIAMEATSATALEGRARLYEKRGAFDKAIADYSTSYKTQPSREVAMKLAALYLRVSQPQAAIGIYRTLLIEKPDDVEARLEMAQALKDNGQVDEAAKEIEKLLTLQTANVKLLIAAGDIYFQEAPEKAAQYYQRAVQAEPANNRARVQLGAALVRAMQFETAIPWLSEALNREPENYVAHANLGTAYFKLKQYLGAAQEFIWIVKVRPETAVSYFFLAISLDHLGDCPQAMRAYQEFARRGDVATYKMELEETRIRLSLLQNLVKAGKCKAPVKAKQQ